MIGGRTSSRVSATKGYPNSTSTSMYDAKGYVTSGIPRLAICGTPVGERACCHGWMSSLCIGLRR